MATAAPARNNSQQPTTEEIERKIDRGIAGAISVNSSVGGLAITSMNDVMEFAKLMACAKVAVPPHLRNDPGACMAICIQAVEWRMSPFAVANKSYVVNDRLGFESQLIHAVIEQRAPLVGRLRHSFSGDGAKRRCKVWGFVKGESEALEYESPETGTIKPKNSPLWVTKPDLQLYYNTSRDWARVYFPDVILGVYADDELADAKPMTPAPLAAGRLDLRKPTPPEPTTDTYPGDNAYQTQTPPEELHPDLVEAARVAASEQAETPERSDADES